MFPQTVQLLLPPTLCQGPARLGLQAEPVDKTVLPPAVQGARSLSLFEAVLGLLPSRPSSGGEEEGPGEARPQWCVCTHVYTHVFVCACVNVCERV